MNAENMDAHALVGYAACILSIASMVPYVRSIIRGETTLSRIGWLIWAIVTSVLFFANIKTGSRFSVTMSLIATVNLWLIFLLSFRYGGARTYWWHYIALFLAMVALGFYFLVQSEIGLLATIIVAESIGAAIIIHKSWSMPESENWSGWMLYFVAALCNLLALRGFDEWYSLKLVYPLYCFATALFVIIPITRYKLRKN